MKKFSDIILGNYYTFYIGRVFYRYAKKHKNNYKILKISLVFLFIYLDFKSFISLDKASTVSLKILIKEL